MLKRWEKVYEVVVAAADVFGCLRLASTIVQIHCFCSNRKSAITSSKKVLWFSFLHYKIIFR